MANDPTLIRKRLIYDLSDRKPSLFSGLRRRERSRCYFLLLNRLISRDLTVLDDVSSSAGRGNSDCSEKVCANSMIDCVIGALRACSMSGTPLLRTSDIVR